MQRSLDPVFARILVGVDGSPNGDEAVRQASRLCAVTGAELLAVSVVEPGSRVRHPGVVLMNPRRRALAALDEAVRLAGKWDVTPETRLVAGSAADALVAEARAAWADLICVGPDAGRALKPRLFGRVAALVLGAAHGSVLIARVPPGDDEASFPARIQCAVDGSRGATEAARVAASLAKLTGAELVFHHVVQTGPALPGRAQHHGDPLPTVLAVADAEGVRASAARSIGAPGASIAAAAAGGRSDLIVLGSRGLHGLKRKALGSTGDWLARHAEHSVLVARPRRG